MGDGEGTDGERDGWYTYAPDSPQDRRPPEPRHADIERPAHLSHLRVLPNGRLLVDRRPLIEIVTEAEAGTDEHDPGGYAWLPRSLVVAPSRHLLGSPLPDGAWGDDWESWGFEAGSVAVGGCGCGEVGCRPLMMVVETGNGLVRWRRFAARRIDDLGIGPFTFDERQYRGALGFDR